MSLNLPFLGCLAGSALSGAGCTGGVFRSGRCPRRDLDWPSRRCLLAFRRTRRAGLGHGAGAGPLYAGGPLRLKAAVRTPAPCDLRPEMLTLVARPHGWVLPSGHTSSAFAAAFCALAAEPQARRPGSCAGRVHRLHADVPVCAFPHRHSGRSWHWALHWGLRLPAGR